MTLRLIVGRSAMNRLVTVVLVLMMSTGSWSQSFANSNCGCKCEQKVDQKKKSFPTKKVILSVVLIGISYYYRGEIHDFSKKYFTFENMDAARKFVVNDVFVPVAEQVRREGPRIIRERLSTIIIGSLIGGLARVF